MTERATIPSSATVLTEESLRRFVQSARDYSERHPPQPHTHMISATAEREGGGVCIDCGLWVNVSDYA
jgi:hypothetical protein